MKRCFAVMVLGIVLGLSAVAGGRADIVPPSAEWGLGAVLAQAVAKSAELASLQTQVKAAEAMAIAAAGRPDPMASAGLVNIPVNSGLSLNKDTMSGAELMFSQELLRGAKLRLQGEAQRQEAEMLRARYADKKNAIVRDVKQAYFDVQYLDGAVQVAEQNKLTAEDLVGSARASYATGKGLQQDVFKSQVQLSRMLDMLIMLHQERAMAAARLNRLLYRAPGETVPSLGTPALSPPPQDRNILQAQAMAHSPKLEEMKARIEQTKYQTRLTGEEFKPDFNYSLGYMIRQPVAGMAGSGDDMWSARVGLTLPWFNRRPKNAGLTAAQATQAAASLDLKAMKNELAEMVEEKAIEIKRTEQQLSLVETALLPQSEGALASSRSAYSTGKLELMSVLDNQMNLYNLQQQRLDLISRHEQGLADLEYLLGGPPPPAGAAPQGEKHD
jgi:outer membrane protein, heavy metal efflux system